MSTILSTIFSMQALWVVLVVIYSLVCIVLMGVIMLQKGKGVGFAGAFGIGPGSETVFGPRGSKSLPVRITQVSAGLFMVLAIVLSLMSGAVGSGDAPELVPVDETGGFGDLEGLGTAAGGAATPAETPAAETPAPAVEVPVPVVETPAPAVETPAPALDATAPAVETPAPATEATPAPAEGSTATPAAPADSSAPTATPAAPQEAAPGGNAG